MRIVKPKLLFDHHDHGITFCESSQAPRSSVHFYLHPKRRYARAKTDTGRERIDKVPGSHSAFGSYTNIALVSLASFGWRYKPSYIQLYVTMNDMQRKIISQVSTYVHMYASWKVLFEHLRYVLRSEGVCMDIQLYLARLLA
jgi:hypothetical protein